MKGSTECPFRRSLEVPPHAKLGQFMTLGAPDSMFKSSGALPLITYLADQHVCLVKVAAVELGRLPGNVLNFDAHLLALACGLDLFVVALD